MKKIILFILPFLLLMGGIWFGYNYYFGGKDYYTRVGEPDKVTTGNFSNGEKYTEYSYTYTAFNKQGEKTIQKTHEIRDKPLRINAYLQLKVNPRKGVLSWEEVSETAVPKEALNKLTE